MKDYKKYRWFYTSSGKLVIGGKNARQNDMMLKRITKEDTVYAVMHTSDPGSPFCMVYEDVSKVSRKDLAETAIFTGCFSKAWKQGKKKTDVDIFRSLQLYKDKRMKTGTWGVAGKVQSVQVPLELVLAIQKKVLRAVPEKTVKRKEVLLKVCPGKIDKISMAVTLLDKMRIEHDKKAELLAALPAGGVKVC